MKTTNFVAATKVKDRSCFLKLPKIAVGVLAFAGSCFVLQAETFPTAGGDISTAEGWGGTLPAADARVAFEAGTYTASQDVAFGAVTNYGDVTFDFTATPERKITINAYTNTETVLYSSGENGSTYQFKGGTWDMPLGGYLCFASSGGRNDSAQRTILLSDGVVFTNAVIVTGVDRDYKSLLRMTGRSAIYCADSFRAISGSTKNSRMEILDGSSVTAVRVFADYQPTQGGPAVLAVSGSDSTLRATGTSSRYASAVGTHLNGHALYVTNSAILDVAGYLVEGQTWSKNGANRSSSQNLICLANNATGRVEHLYMGAYVSSNEPDNSFGGHPDGVASYGNELVVKSGASLAVTQLFIGADRLSHHNRVVVDGGSISCAGTGVHVGHYGWGNELMLTNVTCYTAESVMPRILVGATRGSSNNVLRIAGAASYVVFNGESRDFFQNGPCNEVVIENGACLDAITTRFDGFASTSNSTVRVRSGGRMSVAKTFYVGGKSDSWLGCGNRLVVEDGGSYTNASGGIRVGLSANVAVGAPPNGFVLSNGTVYVNAFTISTNCYAEIAGTNPVLRTTAVNTIMKNATLRFVIPNAGYVATPIVGKGLKMTEDAMLDFDISSKPYLDEPLTLVTGTQALSIPASVLAAANERLGRKGVVYLSADNKNLMLRVWRKGTSVSLR